MHEHLGSSGKDGEDANKSLTTSHPGTNQYASEKTPLGLREVRNCLPPGEHRSWEVLRKQRRSCDHEREMQKSCKVFLGEKTKRGKKHDSTPTNRPERELAARDAEGEKKDRAVRKPEKGVFVKGY